MKALVALALIAAAPPQQKFDLVCTGETKRDLTALGSPYNVTLHVDLEARKWCEGECSKIYDIAEVQPSIIYFEKESSEDKLLHNQRAHFVNRQNGGYIRHISERVEAGIASFRSERFTQGVCEKAPFSGFAKVTTKF